MKTLLRWIDLAVYALFLAYALIEGPLGPWRYVGLGLAVLTVPFWFAARWQLGASFSVVADARHLVTTGVYSRIRHPVYAFGSVAWGGALMVLLGWRAAIIWVFIVAIEALRIRKEERVLADAFGDAYAAWRQQTWF